jgi:hypothetical protein
MEDEISKPSDCCPLCICKQRLGFDAVFVVYTLLQSSTAFERTYEALFHVSSSIRLKKIPVWRSVIAPAYSVLSRKEQVV